MKGNLIFTFKLFGRILFSFEEKFPYRARNEAYAECAEHKGPYKAKGPAIKKERKREI